MSQVNGSAEQQPATEPSTQENPTQNEEPQHSKEQTNLTDPLVAATSLDDTGGGKRPRDARLLHLILMSLGVQAYEHRVPLQLMDFAYRYTSGVLQDAIHLTSEGYGASAPGNKHAPGNDSSNVTLQSIRLAIASRQHYQFQASLPKEHFSDVAAEKNKIALPHVTKNTLRLPPERYRLTGVGYSLKDEWDQEVEIEEATGPAGGSAEGRTNGAAGSDTQMSGVETGDNSGQADEAMEDA